MNTVRIIAIDPGYERLGIAVLEKSTSKKHILLYSTCLKTSKKLLFEERLVEIGKELEKLIKKYNPKNLAIEKLFLNSNQKTVMNVAEVRGMIIYIASKSNLTVNEYTPPQIKVAVTGYGRASKEMVMSMVPRLIDIKSMIKSDDEFDAIATGLTCLACERF